MFYNSLEKYRMPEKLKYLVCIFYNKFILPNHQLIRWKWRSFFFVSFTIFSWLTRIYYKFQLIKVLVTSTKYVSNRIFTWGHWSLLTHLEILKNVKYEIMRWSFTKQQNVFFKWQRNIFHFRMHFIILKWVLRYFFLEFYSIFPLKKFLLNAIKFKWRNENDIKK